MRDGYNTHLQRRLNRSPSDARLILEAVVTEQQDQKDDYAEWSAADSHPNITIEADGTCRLTGTENTTVDQTTHDTGLVNLNNITEDSIDVAVVGWKGDEAENQEIGVVIVRLDPDTGGGQNVDTWKCRLWRLAEVTGPTGSRGTNWLLSPLTTPVEVAAGAVEANVEFAFNDTSIRPVPGPAPTNSDDVTIAQRENRPTTVIQIWGVQSDGSPATNVAWRADTTSYQKDDTDYLLRHMQLTRLGNDIAGGGTVFGRTQGTARPYIQIKNPSFTAGTITFTTSKIDLGAAPSTSNDLECFAGFAEFRGSAVDPQIGTSTSNWTSYESGDLIGVDNSTSGGADLSALAKQQTYVVRATLTPSTNGLSSPALYRMGVRELAKTNLDNLANIGPCRWAVDPMTLRAEIPEIQFELLRDGNVDYHDAASEMLSENHIADVNWRLWIGHSDLDRKHWMLVDEFVTDDVEYAGPGAVVTAVSPLAELRKAVPSASTDLEVEPIEYSANTAKYIYNDLLTNHIDLDDRWVGKKLQSTEIYARALKDVRPGKDYLDQITFLAGHSCISSQGRLKAVSFYDRATPLVELPREEIKEISITPGFRSRLTEYTVYYGWDDRRDDGRGAFKGQHTQTYKYQSNVGRALIDVTSELDHDTAKWIPETASTSVGSTSAAALVNRMVERFGPGTILWTVETIYPHPELEPGDVVAVESDRFVARAPESGRELRGPLRAVARVVCCHNPEGTKFTVWVQSYQDITSTRSDVLWRKYADPEVFDIACEWSTDGKPTYVVACNQDSNAVKVGEDDDTYPNVASVRTESAITLSTSWPTEWGSTGAGSTLLSDGLRYAEMSSTVAYKYEESAYLSALAYETSTGGGAEQYYLFKKRFTREYDYPVVTITPVVKYDGTYSAHVTGNPITESIKITGREFTKTRTASYMQSGVSSTYIDGNSTRYVGRTFAAFDGIPGLGDLTDGSSDPHIGYIGVLAYSSTSSTTVDEKIGGPYYAEVRPHVIPGGVDSTAILNGHVIAKKLQDSSKQFSCTFDFTSTSYDHISWTAGTLWLSDGSDYSINSGDVAINTASEYDTNFVYFSSTESATTLQTSTSLADATEGGSVLLAVYKLGASTAGDAFVVPVVGRGRLDELGIGKNCITADKVMANAITADKIAANAVTAAKINVASLSAINVDAGEIETGLLRNSSGTGTRGIRLSTHYALSTNWQAYIDLASTGTDFIKHPGFRLGSTYVTGVSHKAGTAKFEHQIRVGSWTGGGNMYVGDSSAGNVNNRVFWGDALVPSRFQFVHNFSTGDANLHFDAFGSTRTLTMDGRLKLMLPSTAGTDPVLIHSISTASKTIAVKINGNTRYLSYTT